jgi:hypothetical protein
MSLVWIAVVSIFWTQIEKGKGTNEGDTWCKSAELYGPWGHVNCNLNYTVIYYDSVTIGGHVA